MEICRQMSSVISIWTFLIEVFQDSCCRWGMLEMDPVVARFNNKLTRFVSRSMNLLAIEVDALLTLWDHFNLI